MTLSRATVVGRGGRVRHRERRAHRCGEHPAVDRAPIAAEALLKRATGRTGTPAVNQMLEELGELLRRKK